MFCFQCEQTVGCTGCTNVGVCGKSNVVSDLQDKLIGSLIGLAHIVEEKGRTEKADNLVVDGLFTTLTNVNFDESSIKTMIEEVNTLKNKMSAGCLACGGGCGKSNDYDLNKLWTADEDIRSLKSILLFGIKGIAAYLFHARALGKTSDEVINFLYKGLSIIGYDGYELNDLIKVVLEAGNINLTCMQILNDANKETFGVPAPTKVTMEIEKGAFIIISGHDLLDLKLLLEQTEGKGINIYTHGEMLPAHAYPLLNKYSHLKGHFGTAWFNQQKEFDNVPAPILFTTNCIMPVKKSYEDRVFTTGVVQYPSMVHIDEKRDFSEIIAKSLELGGYKENITVKGMNGGSSVTTGFGYDAILSQAGTIVDAVKKGDISRFFLVGGCDGAKNSRGYYTDFVKNAPDNSVILTLACGKFRFNDLELGDINGIPRLLDMGQCNDAYGAIQVALALANAFNCEVNELPLSIVLSWYEQKAVSVLLTLLALGIKNIHLGPTAPAFISENVLKFLVDNYNIKLTTTAENDLKNILNA